MKAHSAAFPHLFEYDEVILRIIPLVDLLLIPETAHSYEDYQQADHHFV